MPGAAVATPAVAGTALVSGGVDLNWEMTVALDVAGPGAPRAHVAARVRLGEHHRRAPALLDHLRQVAGPLRRGAEAVDDPRHEAAEQARESP